MDTSRVKKQSQLIWVPTELPLESRRLIPHCLSLVLLGPICLGLVCLAICINSSPRRGGVRPTWVACLWQERLLAAASRSASFWWVEKGAVFLSLSPFLSGWEHVGVLQLL